MLIVCCVCVVVRLQLGVVAAAALAASVAEVESVGWQSCGVWLTRLHVQALLL